MQDIARCKSESETKVVRPIKRGHGNPSSSDWNYKINVFCFLLNLLAFVVLFCAVFCFMHLGMILHCCFENAQNEQPRNPLAAFAAKKKEQDRTDGRDWPQLFAKKQHHRLKKWPWGHGYGKMKNSKLRCPRFWVCTNHVPMFCFKKTIFHTYVHVCIICLSYIFLLCALLYKGI